MDLAHLEQLDQELTLAINSLHTSFTDPIMWFFSNKLVWIPMYVAILGLMLWKLGWKKMLVVLLGVVVTIVLCDQTANLFKHHFHRIRPLHNPLMVEKGLHILERGGGFSFFSAHAANAFGITCCTILTFLRNTASTGKRQDPYIRFYCIWMVIWAFMVSTSRIFVGKHFLGDVIVGMVVGILIGLAVGALTNLATRKIVR
ncbi:MAG: phosphatase PAP2 family protein [Candidatus Cryptobacteroides sp.]